MKTNRMTTIVAVALGLVSGCAAPDRTPGKAAPDFELKDLTGKTVSLSSLRGWPILLTFWGVG